MTNLGRQDVERIVEEVLKNLSVSVDSTLTKDQLSIKLKFKDKVLSESYFSINKEDLGL